MYRRNYFLLIFSLLLPSLLTAGTVGKIKGKVIDLQTGEPLIGANVQVVGTTFGAATDNTGEYIIQNLDAGIYQLKASFIGYQTVTLNNVRVNADLTSEAAFRLTPEGVTTGVVEITAIRPLVNKSSTNSVRITTGEDIQALPVRGIDNIIALNAGVVIQDDAVFIRGGRFDEVGYYLEGVSITNPVAGGRAITISQDAVEEIQVQAGGYTAEFGGANAGIIRQQLKTGPKSLKATMEYTTDNIGFQSKDNMFNSKKRLGAYWYGYNEFVTTLGGPVLDERFRFFGLFNYNYRRDDTPQPYSGIKLGVVTDPTTKKSIDLNYPSGPTYGNSFEGYTYTGTLSMDFSPLLLRLSGTFTTSTGYIPFNTNRNSGNISNFMNTARIEQEDMTDGSGTIKLTHLLSPDMFYEITAGYFRTTTNRFDPFLKDNFTAYGDSIANAQFGFAFPGRFTRPAEIMIYDFSFNAPGDVIAGYSKNKRENLSLSGALTWNTFKDHSIKLGADVQRYTIRNYGLANENVTALAGMLAQNAELRDSDPLKVSPEEVINAVGPNAYGYDLFGNEVNDNGIYAPKHPLFAAAYIQDKIEYNDLIINLGLRYDYIYTDNVELLDAAHPELGIDYVSGQINLDGWKKVPPFQSISPRLGLSFPVTDRTVFHAQYGKFVQQTRLVDIYKGLSALADELQGGLFVSHPVGFNLRPTKTTQYEIGFSQQIGEIASFDITGYYKDIKDQVVYDQQTTATGSPFGSYYVYTNGDFATTKGLEVTFNLRRIERIAINASLSFQDARGTGSYPNSNRGIVGAPLDGVTIYRPQNVSPLEYNNALNGNFNIDYRFGEDDAPALLKEFGVSLLMRFNSGHPYTRGLGGANLEGDARGRIPLEPLNASSTPPQYQVDLRIDKSFKLFDRLSANIYVSVINLFDRKNVQNVFLRTGSPTDDGYLSDPSLSGKYASNPEYVALYNAINIDYYEQYQNAIGPILTGAMYGAPRQIRLGVRLEY